MISDLSPGDKLSLKGKIFELQKRLNILDIESKRNNEMSTMFKPTIYTYSLPSRERNVLDSINKAEIIKKQKKELLKASILAQIDEGCTFTPVISNKAKTKGRQGALTDERPAHERLYQHAKQYEENKIQKSLQCKNYDFDGNRLFVPTIIKSASKNPSGYVPDTPNSLYYPGSPEIGDDQSRTMHSSQSSSNSMDTVPADEFLYQDARDRESRIRLRNQMVKEEIIAAASKKKINGLSTVMLRKKAEREARRIFSVLDSHSVGYLDHKTFANYLSSFNATQRKDTQRLWCALDIFQAGKVHLESFLAICIPLLYHSTVSLARQDLESSIKRLMTAGQDQSFATDGDSEGWSRLPSPHTDDLEQLQHFLLAMKTTAAASPSNVRNEGGDTGVKNTTTLISNRSRKLADQKEEKDRKLLSQLMSNANARTGPEQPDGGDSAAVDNEGEGKPVPELSSSAMLFARGKLMDHRKEQLRKELLEQEAELCPFHPKIVSEGFAFSPSLSKRIKSVAKFPKPEVGSNDRSESLPSSSKDGQRERDISEQMHSQFSVSSEDSSLSVFERLYGKYKYGPLPPPPPPPPDVHQSPSSAPWDESDIRNSKWKRDGSAILNNSFANNKPPAVRTKPIEGFEKSVQRIRAVNEEKQRQKEMELNEWKVEDEKYRKSRELAKKGFLPFELKADKRFQDKKDKSLDAKSSKPRLIVEVRLSKTKVAKIKIREGDNPADVAARFAKIYSLDGQTEEVLTTVVRESMLANQIAMRSTGGSVASSAASRRRSRDGSSSSSFHNKTYEDKNSDVNNGSRANDGNHVSRDMPPVSWSGEDTQQFSTSARDIEEESLSMYSYYDDDTVELDLEDDDEYNQSQPSESPYPNRQRQSRSSSENEEMDMISEEEEDEEEKTEFNAKNEGRLFSMTSTINEPHGIGPLDSFSGDDLHASKVDNFTEDSDDGSDVFPFRRTFDGRPII